MAPPSAEKPAQNERGENGQSEENKSRVEIALIERVHGLRRLNRRDGSPRDPPVDEVPDDEQVDADQDGRSSGSVLGFSDAGRMTRKDGERNPAVV